MDKEMQDKAIEITTDYKNQSLNLQFSENLVESKERGYILSAAFFSYCADQGLTKKELLKLVDDQYNNFIEK